jgi:AcrR family transcriptional regulator
MGRIERQQQAREATRRAILDAALELFVKDGYAQVSIRNIATKVEYSPGAIYSYFPSKDDIFFALAEEGLRVLGPPELDAGGSDNPLEELRETAWRIYDFSRQHPQLFALVFLDRHVPRIGREHERFAFLAQFKNHAIARMQRCIESGILPPDLDALAALRLLLSPIFGLSMLKLSERLAPNEDPDQLVRDSIETTIAGLRSGAAVRARSAAEGVRTDLSNSHARTA